MELNSPPTRTSEAFEDDRLVAEAVKGEPAAFTALFERHHAAVSRFVRNRTQQHPDAEDLAIEALSRAFLKIDTFVPRHTFSTWLYKIAINHCIDHSRRLQAAKNSCRLLELDFVSDWTDEQPNPEEAIILQEQRRMAAVTLGRIPPLYRRMLELRYLDELSYMEIAEHLVLPLGTVKAQLHRAKELARAAAIKD